MSKFINVRNKITPVMMPAQEAHVLPPQPSIPTHRSKQKTNLQVSAGASITPQKIEIKK